MMTTHESAGGVGLDDLLVRDLGTMPADAGEAFRAMTFPAYRHLLALQPAPRHPEDGDTRLVQPLGLAAWRNGRPIGMVLTELPIADALPPEVLSLFVHPEARNHGVATALVSQLESTLHARGFSSVQAVYMTGSSSVEPLERVWAKRAWDTPATRSVTVRFTPEQAAGMPWFGRVRLPASDFQIFPWAELTREDKREIATSQQASSWIPTELEPWRHDHQGFDSVSSVGLRFRGHVVGWVINHRLAPNLVRFTCSYMREDLSRRARILPLYTSSVRRLLDDGGVRMCSMITPMGFGPMVEFVRDHIAAWATFFGETKGTQKGV
jgi:GNAT superfamily N-acetyltransferase